jgi:CubicO group peptidase (beta-lactamase class C family)
VDEAVGTVVRPDGPGCAVVILHDGQVVHEKGYGLADLEARTPIAPTSTAFDLASCSKQFTATACLILVERGKLSLADDARRYLPELPSYGPRPIRVGDLLHHSSGLPDYTRLLGDGAALARMRNADALRLVAREKKLDFATGAKGGTDGYSNTNYCLAALIVERISKKSLGAFLQTEVFDPLGMKATVVYERPGQIVPGRARGYRSEGQRFAASACDGCVTGDGNVFSTAADLARWDRALRERKILKPASIDLLFAPGRLDSGELLDYGLGWCVGASDGRRFVNHAGSWAGTSTYIMRFLDRGDSAIVLSNDEGLDAAGLGERVLEAYLGK